ncbi:DivIVA domain-containing protein [Phycicoccus duodecadis]|uniref:DivIVA domain-containing protein n=1 Tax=Phycicoccus duodecadis TaxID=173053 RepID=A0A2N3YH69_9MICO|nr:DivIVA domain-containing protein [Phycicoccus duodecadis]PKW26180.1 DivIVA domain-containing protein [Phycicoccus duodecadis]
MTWSFLAALAAVATLAGAAWWLGRPRPDAPADGTPAPEGFATALRGYRMDQVDEVLDRLEARVADREREIAVLRGEARDETPGGPAAGAPTALATRALPDAPPDRPDRPVRPLRPARQGLSWAVAGTPRPWGRPDLLAPLAYLLVAAYVTMHLLTAVRTGYLSQGVQDQQAFEWYFGATAHNVATFSNPLISDLQNFPDGVNLMANAAVLGLGLPLTPLTLLAGPQVTFVLVELLGLALTASAWYWLFRRRLPVHPLAAFLGGLLAGFGPGMVSHANGHPNFVVQVLVPVILDRLLRLARGSARPVRDGVVLGLLVAWQVLIGEEVLLLTSVGVLVLLLGYLAAGWRPTLAALRGLGTGVGVALVITALPLWWQFLGPQSYTSIYHPPAGNDLAQLWGRASRTVGADPWAAAAVSMNRTEENSFFGIPLWGAAAATLVVLWRSVLVRVLAVVVVLSCWLSLGEELTLHGTPLGIPGPWALLEHVPVVENVLPTRFTLIALPAFAALLALGAEAARRAVLAVIGERVPALVVGIGVGAMVLLPVVPTPLVVDPRSPMPTFFSEGAWRDYVDDGGSILAVPPPDVADTRALEWQAEARWGFPVVAGYFVGPDGTAERGGRYGATPTALAGWLAEVAQSGVAQPAGPEQKARFDDDLRAGRVDALVLPVDRPAADALLASVSSVYGRPTTIGGVHVWDVREVTDGAR